MGTFRKSKRSRRRSKKSESRSSLIGSSYGRRLRVEQLEDRRMLAVITVTSLADNLFLDGSVTLREAIAAANTDTSVDGSVAGNGADTINFSAALSGQTIILGGTELAITDTLTIDATALANGITIDANNSSRIFNITAASGNFELAGLTLTGARTIGPNEGGGAIRSLTTNALTINQSTISGSSTMGDFAEGGGIFATGEVLINNSTVSGNSTTGVFADGGGIFTSSGNVTLTSSTISDNSTEGVYADGGGIIRQCDAHQQQHRQRKQHDGLLRLLR